MSASFLNYVLWDMRRDQASFDNLNCFLRTPTNTDNMLFLRMNYLDRQNYNDIRRTAAPALVMTAFSSHSDLHGGLKNFHSLVRMTLDAHRFNPGRLPFSCSLFGCFFLILHFYELSTWMCWITRKGQLHQISIMVVPEWWKSTCSVRTRMLGIPVLGLC